MSLYNMLFGQNPQADLLLAVIGLRTTDVQRFRDVHASDDGTSISVYTRTGGGNREGYPNLAMRSKAGWRGSVDDDYDSTYCTDEFAVPAEFVSDVIALRDVLHNGIRKEFAQHLGKTIGREPTDADKAQVATTVERQAISGTRHILANGHTFVPLDDGAMDLALGLAEANGGALLSCWGIMPLKITVATNVAAYPNTRDEMMRKRMTRAEISHDPNWAIDAEYWAHCRELFLDKYPAAMAKIADEIESQRDVKAGQNTFVC